MRSQTRRFRAEWLALATMLLIIAALIAGTLSRERADVQRQEGERLQAEARVIDDNLIRQLEGADKALGGIAADLGGPALSTDIDALTAKLKLLTGAMPGFSSMLVLNAEGTIVASSRDGLAGKNFRQRDYFDAPRRGADPAVLHLSEPFTTTLGTYVMVASRALMDRDGRFIGVVTATLDPDYFNVVLRSVLYAPDMRTTLIHRDGKVFLNMPSSAPAATGANAAAPGSLFAQHRDGFGTATLAMGQAPGTEGADRMVALRTIDRQDLRIDKPMVVAVSRATVDVLLPWRARAWQFGGLFAALALAANVGLFLNHRRRRAFGLIEEAVARERQAGAERLELALRGADLGLWDLHVPSGDLIVNARERALLGFGPDDALPNGGQWNALIHPDDRALVEASILPHLRGEAATYACEHRMLRRDGEYAWLSNRAMIVERDERGAPLRIIGTHLDVGERKRAEERLADAAARLRESEEELRLVADNMPALVSRVDREQRFRFVNRAYGDWLRIDPATLLGRSLLEVYGDVAYADIEPRVKDALAGHKVVFDRTMPTPGGVRRVEVTLAPQFGADGSVTGVYALANDITARHEAEARQMRSEERLSLALEGSGLALFDWNIADDSMYHSAQAAAMRGDTPVAGTSPAVEMQSFVHPDDLAPMLARLKAAVVGETPVYHAEFRLRRTEGDWLWVRARGRVVQRDAAGRALRLAGTYADINDRKIAENRMRRLAEFDTLTGLPNRAVFHDRLRQAMARATRGQPMALLFLDIDRFKSINDTLGHEAGDTLLKVFATRMQGAVRQSDTVARLAGDEFTIILEQLRDPRDARMLANKLIETLREPVVLAGEARRVTASIGIALCLPGETDDAALLRRADAALYEVKRRGRDGYCLDEARSELQAERPTLMASDVSMA